MTNDDFEFELSIRTFDHAKRELEPLQDAIRDALELIEEAYSDISARKRTNRLFGRSGPGIKYDALDAYRAELSQHCRNMHCAHHFQEFAMDDWRIAEKSLTGDSREDIVKLHKFAAQDHVQANEAQREALRGVLSCIVDNSIPESSLHARAMEQLVAVTLKAPRYRPDATTSGSSFNP